MPIKRVPTSKLKKRKRSEMAAAQMTKQVPKQDRARPRFSELPLERQLLAATAFADSLMASGVLDASQSRDQWIAKSHEILLSLPDELFD
jgi:hypothetical protein